MASLAVNDLFDELREENLRLSNELLFANKCLLVLFKYRSQALVFSHNCNCIENLENKLKLNDIELEYNTVIGDYNVSEGREVVVSIENTEQFNASTDDHINTIVKRPKRNLKRNGRNFKRVANNNSSNLNKMSELSVVKQEDTIYSDDVQNETLLAIEYERPSKRYAVEPLLNEITKSVNGYRCDYPFCDFEHESKRNVCQHIKKMHINKEPLSCDTCEKKIWGRQRMIRHKQSEHCDLTFLSDSKKYKCDWDACPFECKSLTSMREHVRRHLGDKQFHCDVQGCDSSFVTNNELKMHRLLVHSDETPYHCDWPGCESSFKTSQYLKKHMIAHTGNYPFKCDYPECEMNFVNKCDLKYHQLVTHSDELPYKCEWPGCEFGSKTKNGLRRHNFTHTGEKPLKCEWPGCEARFYMGSHLNRHKLTHNTYNTYFCDWPDCKRSFKVRQNLKLHMMHHRGEKPFKCEMWPQCQKRFKEKFRMIIHSRKMHKNKDT